jgi:hypothetical protein
MINHCAGRTVNSGGRLLDILPKGAQQPFIVMILMIIAIKV